MPGYNHAYERRIMSARLPELIRETRDPAELETDVLVVAVRKEDDDIAIAAPLLDSAMVDALAAAARAVGHTGAADTSLRIQAPAGLGAASVVLIGIGGADVMVSPVESDDVLRSAAGSALRSLSGVDSVAVLLPIDDTADAEAVAIGALLGAYRDARHKSKAPTRGPIERIALCVPNVVEVDTTRCATIAGAVAAARDLVNEPPLDLYPETFAEAVVREAGADDLRGLTTVTVTRDDELRERGFGGLIGVGSGSTRGPRLVRVDYVPEGAERHLAFVGKGITFDSGGISLKPAAKMEKMKSDMAGAAAAVEALFGIARLRLPVRVTAWLALAENMPSGSAVRPADVLRIYGGTTVEVTNTDAEGRLVLADALVAAQEEGPDLIIDIATLTGAQVAALGYRTSGVMGTDSARERVTAAAGSVGEPMWPMPIPNEMIRYFDSQTADLRNAGAPGGGMLAATAFLREFVAEGTEWAHLDIAGPAINADSAYGFTVLGGTGVPVRTLIALAENES